MRIHLVARKPTDSVTGGFLPAAARLGAEVTVVTDEPAAHRRAYAGPSGAPPAVVGAEVTDARELVGALSRLGRPDAVVSNSDHLQVQAALAADWFDLPAKPWRAALRCKNKALMRRQIRTAGLDAVFAVELLPGTDVPRELRLPGPWIVKPREGVASEEVFLVADAAELRARVAQIRARRPGAALVVEEYLDGPLRTLETLGDAHGLHVLGGFSTRLGPLPHFVETGLDWDPEPGPEVVAQVLAQLAALGVGLGACHTEYVLAAGRARLVEVNYRLIGDQCDLLLAELLGPRGPGTDLFGLVLHAHLGTPCPPVAAADAAPEAAPAYGHARVEYVCADRAGVLVEAPGPLDLRDGNALPGRAFPGGQALPGRQALTGGQALPGRQALTGGQAVTGRKALLRYRPLRAPGTAAPLTRTNRDYLGVLRALGTDRPAVDRAVEDFLAAHTWRIEPG